MKNDQNFIMSFSDFMDQNIKGVQYGLYSTALVGLTIALRSVRPFKKFTIPQSLPASFLQKHVKLRGQVIGVDPPGKLQVDHYPIFKVWPKQPQALPVGVESIRVMGHGTSWLQTVINGQVVTITPISADPDVLSCIVTCTGKNVGVQLVSLGMATVTPIRINLKDDILYKQYYEQLLQAEDKAEKKRVGLWANTPPPPSLLNRTLQKSAEIVMKGINSFKTVAPKVV